MESKAKASNLKMDVLKETPKCLIKRCRRLFNQQHNAFKSSGVLEETNIDPDDDLNGQFQVKLKCDRSTQWNINLSEHQVNVDKVCIESCGVNHVEGGWPKDISYLDLEQTIRYRKKMEKDENYIENILRLGNVVEHGIKQNNALNIYQDYFPSKRELAVGNRKACPMRILTLLRDPLGCSRPVTGISWSANKKLAISYSNACHSLCATDAYNEAFIWDIGDCAVPEVNLRCPSCPVCVEFNPKDTNGVVGGCSSGQVVYWDIRRAPSFACISNPETSHRDCVRSVLWLNSKSGTEFFSAGLDGQVCWWDTRKLDRPMDSLLLDPTRGMEGQAAQAAGATCIEFEPSMSTKFMVGTETGTVFLCNSKAKSIQEKLAQMYSAHLGTVHALQRNPIFPKNFLTVGDWTAKIWSEDVRESPIYWTGYRMAHMTAACWSPTRPSVYFAATEEGVLLLYDLLVDHHRPLDSLKVVDKSLSCIRVHESGSLVACGALDGRLAIVKLTEDASVLSKTDKALLTALFERETKRERILEARQREQKLRDKIPPWEQTEMQEPMSSANCERCSLAEKQFVISLQ